jgi:hypothetical protein
MEALDQLAQQIPQYRQEIQALLLDRLSIVLTGKAAPSPSALAAAAAAAAGAPVAASSSTSGLSTASGGNIVGGGVSSGKSASSGLGEGGRDGLRNSSMSVSAAAALAAHTADTLLALRTLHTFQFDTVRSLPDFAQ